MKKSTKTTTLTLGQIQGKLIEMNMTSSETIYLIPGTKLTSNMMSIAIRQFSQEQKATTIGTNLTVETMLALINASETCFELSLVRDIIANLDATTVII